MKFFKKIIFWGLLAIAFISSIMTVKSCVFLFNNPDQTKVEFRKQMGKEMQLIADALEEGLFVLESAGSLAERLSSGRKHISDMEVAVQSILKSGTYIYGVGVAYHPYSASKQEQRRSPYYFRKKIDRANDRPIRAYEQPITYKDRKTGQKFTIGTLFVDFSAIELKKVLQSFEVGDNSYAFLLSSEGRILLHPDRSLSRSDKSDKALLKLDKARLNHKRGVFTVDSQVSEKKIWYVYEPLSTIDWTLVTVATEKEDIETGRLVQRNRISAVLWGMLFLTSFILLPVKAYKGRLVSIRGASVSISIILMLGLCVIWYFIVNPVSLTDTGQIPVVNQSELASIKAGASKEQSSLMVPVGIQILSIQEKENGVYDMSGHVWQKYTQQRGSLARGVMFAGSIREKIELIDVREYREYDLYRWKFQVSVKQDVDVSKYPFDSRNLVIRIWPKEFERKMLLVPDFISYKELDPQKKPGLSSQISLLNWNIKNSFYSYQESSEFYGSDQFELQFNIQLQRRLSTIIIFRLVPLLTIMICLFLLTLVNIRDKSGADRRIAIAAVFLLALVVSHMDLNRSLAVRKLMFMDAVYMLLYAFIVLFCLNTVIVSYTKRFQWLQARYNLMAKVLYWPLFLWCMIIASILMFY